ncbi:MAG: response regulator transcription factor [Verrucomicrobia bacterium]|nr:response regulator transcription factor [Verrucomicrobiota bacterium]
MTSGQQPNRKRVLIVDDHPITRSGLVQLINSQPDLEVCGEAGNAANALSALDACDPDLAIVDITLPDKNGLELIKDIRALRPGLPILVISMHEESLYAERVLRAGARGYVMKREGGEKLMQAIRQVAKGKISLSERMSGQILELFSGREPRRQRSRIEQLSDREFEVFELIGAGLSAREIAAKLHLSAKTVQAHRANIMRKLKVKSVSRLVSYSAHWI